MFKKEKQYIVDNLLRKVIIVTIIGGSSMLLISCGGGSSSEVLTAQPNEISKEQAQSILAPKASSIAALPPEPNRQQSNTSISGVDSNSNGVRDDIEIVLAKSVLHNGNVASAGDFTKLINLVKYIHPSEIQKTIDQKSFYCQYQSLPANIKAKISMQMLITLVTDTAARKRAYATQSINTSGSLGAEICQ